MDAISFVLGVQSRQLRSNQLKDLLHKSGLTLSAETSAHVSLVYDLDQDEQQRIHAKLPGGITSNELTFTRCISEKGIGSYRINNHEKSYEEYESTLKDLGILVKARNFLVFQGDVESIASKSPEQLTRMFELISSSEELKEEYEKCLQEKAIAEENTIFAYQKRKGLAAERKIVKEQKEEAERYKQRRKDLAKTKQEYYLWQVKLVEDDASDHKDAIVQLREKVAKLQDKEHELAGVQKEKKKLHATQLKKCRQLDTLVADVTRKLEDVAPRTIQLNEQIKHDKKKLEAASAKEYTMAKNVQNHEREILGLRQDIKDLKHAQNELDASKDDEELVLKGTQLKEYNRIKETAQLKTAKLRNELESVGQQQADNGRLQALLRDEKEHTDELSRMNEDHAVAEARLVDYLREQRLESVQFIPLDKIRVTPPNERFRRLGDNIKLVVDVIDCDPEFQPAVAYAVSDAIVCDSIEDARDVCFRRNEKVKAVTLNGMVVSKNGSMTGGKTYKDTARSERWDEKETASLKVKRDELQAKESTGVVRKQTLETKLGSLMNRLRYANADIKTTESKLPKILARKQECTKILMQLVPEINKIRGALSARESNLTSLEHQINSARAFSSPVIAESSVLMDAWLQVEDTMFEGFSQQFGIPSIREYEEKVVKQQRERLERRRQLDSHLAKVQAQRHLKELESEKKGLQAKTAELEETSTKHVEATTAAHDALKEIEHELKILMKKRDDHNNIMTGVQKQLAVEETALERFKDKKTEILKRATMDQVKLPVVGEAATAIDDDEIGDSDIDMSSHSIVATGSSEESISLTYQAGDRYADKEINFSTLEDLHLDTDKMRQDHLVKYEQLISTIAGDLERMQPNLKALEKYDEIQARISREEEELEKIKVGLALN
ncbi:hypothetical protein DYB32_000114 [Aphanomyces invadans]|uniref:SMC hinge domain-containing protein n=1 Tax=Aphanomyces invadans TaxID=157072 RepID=A0A3R6W508_9STRA|nr:hypothetical protein DYB32_000114 [Aphanomyces invadans]